jgi:DNA-binding MarR family transcriptional regulator
VTIDEVTDEVDSIVAGWRCVLPDVNVSPLQILSRVTRLAKHLDRLRTDVFAHHELESWTFDVLSSLRRSSPPHEMSAGELVTATLVTSGTMTHRIDTLVERGLATRRASPSDARVVLVRLTPRGRRRVDAALSELATREEELVSVLNGPHQEALAELLRSLLASFAER